MTDDDETHGEEHHSSSMGSIRRIVVPYNCSRYHLLSCVAFTVSHLLTDGECQTLLRMAASSRFRYITEAAHKTVEHETMTVRLQNPNPHKLVVLEHPPTVQLLWSKLEPLLLEAADGRRRPVGINPRLRILRYDSIDDDRFEPHYDATTTMSGCSNDDDTHRSSLWTVLLYLNEGREVDFSGGETKFLANDTANHWDKRNRELFHIIPTMGKVLVFEHDLYHSGSPLAWGTKFVLRTDVFFSSDCATIDCPTNSTDSIDEKKLEDTWRHADGSGGGKSVVPCGGGCSSSPPPRTTTELCRTLGLSEKDMVRMDELGMLDITLDSFLAPGITALELLLEEGGFQKRNLDRLIRAAVYEIERRTDR